MSLRKAVDAAIERRPDIRKELVKRGVRTVLRIEIPINKDALDVRVRKRSGDFEALDPNKIFLNLRDNALKDRGFGDDAIASMTADIIGEATKSLYGRNRLDVRSIDEQVMRKLEKVDQVALVRYILFKHDYETTAQLAKIIADFQKGVGSKQKPGKRKHS